MIINSKDNPERFWILCFHVFFLDQTYFMFYTRGCFQRIVLGTTTNNVEACDCDLLLSFAAAAGQNKHPKPRYGSCAVK